MDDLLREFIEETNESLDVVDVELVKFEQEPNNAQILDNIFRLVHTIKGTCGFLGLPRLESLAHAAETLMGKFRDGAAVTGESVSVILLSLDRIKEIVSELAENQAEPEGSDDDLIDQLDRLSGIGKYANMGGVDAVDAKAAPAKEPVAVDEPAKEPKSEEASHEVYQVLERELKEGEVSLDDLERAFRETDGPDDFDVSEAAKEAAEAAVADAAAKKRAGIVPAKPKDDAAAAKAARRKAPEKDEKAEKETKSGGSHGASIRVNVETLEHLMTMVSELVLTRNQLLEIVRRHEDSEFKVPLQRLSNVTVELQEGVMKTRMQPIGNAWQKLPRVVRDLANDLEKTIDLVMIGQDTELDRQVLELIKDPLTHMVRNSADHGLEMPDERVAMGKPAKGTITLSAYHEGGHIIIDIADDGRGINTEKVKEKILKSELATEAELDKMTEQQINKYIFAAGFSTAEKVTNVSGRGVGMDVVRNNIEVIGGSVDLKSIQGKGSTFSIKIPLTLAIVSTLLVEASGDRFAIPQLSVVELVRVQNNSEHKIERIKDTPVLRLRNKLLPLIHLSNLLGIEEKTDEEMELDDNGFIVVMQVGPQTFGVVVDAVFHTEEIVVKPMASMLRHLTLFSGNTILGDGSVIMILDPNGVAQAFGSHVGTDVDADKEAAEKEALPEEQNTVSLLIFRAGSSEPKAVPLSLVTRLEEFEISKIEFSNGRDMVQYRGSLMPLVQVNDFVQRRTEGSQPMLVFSDSGRSMGLVVDEIVDIVDEQLNIEVSSEVPGVLGTAVIKGKATEIIDVGHFLPQAFEDWFHRKEMSIDEPLVKKLLFVDDSSFFRNMLGPVLKAAGYEVTVCSSGAEALAALERDPSYEIVVSDIEMPEMNGFELCEAVRRAPATRDIPIIALSSLCTPAAIERGRKAGFNDYVAKFDRPGLIASLKEQHIEVGVAA
ncbi:two-component system, chemotaxis family, sensor kinase CheA [Cohaesibacter sp. ES.047]|uniref:hybrid sensor histidine kinase/response regulator n=1 Tax=Cohaesibacter sp. ES.047 TaxID=1798205 RepID=UPI000BB7BCD6|nr:chemotaxis protein CheW [Cohaesibacter sp. ES.047]SNY91100.1 two-component system, chemotaxis family, sensor kinase CheA [Cohaesibacter sp. ES.047]